jgi:hypothetical protein
MDDKELEAFVRVTRQFMSDAPRYRQAMVADLRELHSSDRLLAESVQAFRAEVAQEFTETRHDMAENTELTRLISRGLGGAKIAARFMQWIGAIATGLSAIIGLYLAARALF